MPAKAIRFNFTIKDGNGLNSSAVKAILNGVDNSVNIHWNGTPTFPTTNASGYYELVDLVDGDYNVVFAYEDINHNSDKTQQYDFAVAQVKPHGLPAPRVTGASIVAIIVKQLGGLTLPFPSAEEIEVYDTRTIGLSVDIPTIDKDRFFFGVKYYYSTDDWATALPFILPDGSLFTSLPQDYENIKFKAVQYRKAADGTLIEGNLIDSASSKRIIIDTVAPDIVIKKVTSEDGSKILTQYINMYSGAKIRVYAQISDATSGVAKVQYSTNGSSWADATFITNEYIEIATAALPEGILSIALKAIDNAKHETVVSTILLVDRIPPAKVTDVDYSFGKQVSLSYRLPADIDLAGVEVVQKKADDSLILVFDGLGNYIKYDAFYDNSDIKGEPRDIQIRTYDRAGNYSDAEVVSVKNYKYKQAITTMIGSLRSIIMSWTYAAEDVSNHKVDDFKAYEWQFKITATAPNLIDWTGISTASTPDANGFLTFTEQQMAQFYDNEDLKVALRVRTKDIWEYDNYSDWSSTEVTTPKLIDFVDMSGNIMQFNVSTHDTAGTGTDPNQLSLVSPHNDLAVLVDKDFDTSKYVEIDISKLGSNPYIQYDFMKSEWIPTINIKAEENSSLRFIIGYSNDKWLTEKFIQSSMDGVHDHDINYLSITNTKNNANYLTVSQTTAIKDKIFRINYKKGDGKLWAATGIRIYVYSTGTNIKIAEVQPQIESIANIFYGEKLFLSDEIQIATSIDLTRAVTIDTNGITCMYGTDTANYFTRLQYDGLVCYNGGALQAQIGKLDTNLWGAWFPRIYIGGNLYNNAPIKAYNDGTVTIDITKSLSNAIVNVVNGDTSSSAVCFQATAFNQGRLFKGIYSTPVYQNTPAKIFDISASSTANSPIILMSLSRSDISGYGGTYEFQIKSSSKNLDCTWWGTNFYTTIGVYSMVDFDRPIVVSDNLYATGINFYSASKVIDVHVYVNNNMNGHRSLVFDGANSSLAMKLTTYYDAVDSYNNSYYIQPNAKAALQNLQIGDSTTDRSYTHDLYVTGIRLSSYIAGILSVGNILSVGTHATINVSAYIGTVLNIAGNAINAVSEVNVTGSGYFSKCLFLGYTPDAGNENYYSIMATQQIYTTSGFNGMWANFNGSMSCYSAQIFNTYSGQASNLTLITFASNGNPDSYISFKSYVGYNPYYIERFRLRLETSSRDFVITNYYNNNTTAQDVFRVFDNTRNIAMLSKVSIGVNYDASSGSYALNVLGDTQILSNTNSYHVFNASTSVHIINNAITGVFELGYYANNGSGLLLYGRAATSNGGSVRITASRDSNYGTNIASIIMGSFSTQLGQYLDFWQLNKNGNITHTWGDTNDTAGTAYKYYMNCSYQGTLSYGFYVNPYLTGGFTCYYGGAGTFEGTVFSGYSNSLNNATINAYNSNASGTAGYFDGKLRVNYSRIVSFGSRLCEDTFYNNSTGEFCRRASSMRYKFDFRPITEIQKTNFMALNAVQYRYINDPKYNNLGFIAEQVYPLFPEYVAINKNGLPESVNYRDMVSIITAVLQEHIKEGKNQEARIHQLELDMAVIKNLLTTP
ncbi:MAG: tail fiber domain-containing protein [Clostridia bacterium]|nr:tail fiber domain-containing protein [Clostridia bacterium]